MIDIPDFVYPKDDHGNPLCPRCRKPVKDCACPSGESSKPKQSLKGMPKIILDKSGRKGKVVTIIQGVSPSEAYLKDMSKKLKVKTGSGGAYYVEGAFCVIELQRDHKAV